MRCTKPLAVAALVVAAAATTTHATAGRPLATAYPTRCVHATLPPNGKPLPEVCVVYPL